MAAGSGGGGDDTAAQGLGYRGWVTRWASLGAAAIAAAIAAGGCGEPEGTSAVVDASTGSTGATTAADDAEPVEVICTPGGLRSCYDGPPFTEGIGACRPGRSECVDGGTRWSDCVGEVWPQAERCDTPQDDDCDGTDVCEPTVAWWQELGADPSHMVVDAQGHIIVAGTTGAFTFQGVDLADMYVLEIDEEGTLLWAHSIVATGVERVTDLVVDDQGAVTMVGWYSGEPNFGGDDLPDSPGTSAFIARYDTDGVHQWSHGVLDLDAHSALAVDDIGQAYVAGRVELDIRDGKFVPLQQLRLGFYDPQGQLRWEQTIHDVSDITDQTTSLAIVDDTVVMAAVFGPGFGSAPLRGELPIDVEISSPVVARFTPEGSLVDWRQFEEPWAEVGDLDVFDGDDGEMLLVANILGFGPDVPNQSVMLQRVGTELETISVQFVGNPSWAVAVHPYAGGTTLLVLEFAGWLELGPVGVGSYGFGQAMAVTAVDDAGEARWLELLESPSFETFYSAAVGPSGEVILAGFVEGPTPLADQAVDQAFIAKLRP